MYFRMLDRNVIFFLKNQEIRSHLFLAINVIYLMLIFTKQNVRFDKILQEPYKHGKCNH